MSATPAETLPAVNPPPAFPGLPEPAREPAPPRAPRYRSLDIWRGVACLMVIIYHSTFSITEAAPPDGPPGGVERLLAHLVWNFWFGVPIFFVISGYCIAAACDSTRRRGARMGDFFRRRFRRIFPPYWAYLAALTLASGLASLAGCRALCDDRVVPIAAPSALSPAQWFGNLTLTETWRSTVLVGPLGPYKGPRLLLADQAWTLCYEEQFYAVCGLVLVLAPRRFFAGVAIVTLACSGAFLLHFTRFRNLSVGFFFDGHWFIFACGVLVYYLLNYNTSRRVLAGSCAALVASGAAAWVLPTSLSFVAHSYLAGAAFSLALLALHPGDRRMAGLAALAPLAFCGRMCYSLYLVHWPLVKAVSHAARGWGVTGVWPTLVVTVPACILASVAVAWCFHLLVERRFLSPAPA